MTLPVKGPPSSFTKKLSSLLLRQKRLGCTTTTRKKSIALKVALRTQLKIFSSPGTAQSVSLQRKNMPEQEIIFTEPIKEIVAVADSLAFLLLHAQACQAADNQPNPITRKWQQHTRAKRAQPSTQRFGDAVRHASSELDLSPETVILQAACSIGLVPGMDPLDKQLAPIRYLVTRRQQRAKDNSAHDRASLALLNMGHQIAVLNEKIDNLELTRIPN